jgi:hypothetical protein
MRKMDKPCSKCGTVLPHGEQIRNTQGVVRCDACVQAELLENASDTDACVECGEPIGAHRELNDHGHRLVCSGCGSGTASTSPATSPGLKSTEGRKVSGSTAEDEVAAELERLMGPARRSADAAGGRAPAPSARVTEAELIAAMDERARQRAASPATAAAPAPTKPPQAARLTEEDVAAELEKLMGSPAA